MRILSMFMVICLLSSVSFAQLSIPPINTPVNASSVVNAAQPLNSEIQAIVADEYILGPGDRLEVHLIVGDNALVLNYTFVINPEGKIFFPNVSEISLIGLSLKAAHQKLAAEIKKKYKERFELFLMVSVPKMINIYVTGQIANPGLRVVYDGSRISSVLKDAGVAKGGSDLSE